MGIISPKEAAARSAKDYLRDNRFEIALGGALAAGSDVTDHCIGASMPGTQYGTIEYRSASPVLKLPNDVIYNPLRLTFLNSTDGLAWKHFQELNTKKIITSIRGDYSFNFFDEYSGSVIVNQFDGAGNIVHTVEYVNAYVVGIDDNILSMESMDTVNRFNAILNYEYYI
ncbi:MAG: hypothetical protein QM489_00355 [Candidatus Izemoplasma sp.]